MLNRSEILRAAWSDYRRDEFKGWGVRRGEAFNRQHFGYCLRQAWAAAKARAAVAAQPVAVVPAAKTVTPAVAARVEAIRNELLDMDMGDFVPWSRRAAITTELAALA